MTKAEAIIQLHQARQSLSVHGQGAKQALSPTTLVQNSFQKHKAWWIGGATVAGLLVVRSLVSSQKRKNRRSQTNERDNPGESAKKAGLIALILPSLLALGKKAAVSYVSNNLLTRIEPFLKPQDPS